MRGFIAFIIAVNKKGFWSIKGYIKELLL